MKQKVCIIALSFFLLGSLAGCNSSLSSSLGADSIQDASEVSSVGLPSSSSEVKNGVVRGKILSDNGETIIAGIIVEDSEGNTFRTTTNIFGAYDISLKPGDYKLTFTKGAEFETATKEVTVESLKKLFLADIRLKQLEDSYAKGWIAGDLHQHTFYSDGADSVQSLLTSNISQGLYYGFLSDHNVARGCAEWYNGKYLPVFNENDGEARFFSPYEAVEETTEFGHFQSLGAALTFDKYDIELYAYERAYDAEKKSKAEEDRIKYIVQEIKRSGAVAQINHPYSVSTMGFNHWDLADLFDTIEIWNGVFAPCDGRYEVTGQNYESKMKWYELLNAGTVLFATGGTDNHDTTSPGTTKGISFDKVTNYKTYAEYCADGGKYSGMPTTYANTSDMSKDGILSALKAGHSFVSNGPVSICSVDGVTYGGSVTVEDGQDISIKTDIFNRDGIEGVNIVKNGVSAKLVNLENKPQNFSENISLSGMKKGDWIVVETYGPTSQYAISNPIFFI